MTNGITFTKAYATTDGKTFATLEEAKRHELRELLFNAPARVGDVPINTNELRERLLDAILSNSASVLNILSTTASSRPKARKANGATRKRSTRVDPMANPERAGSNVESVHKQTAE